MADLSASPDAGDATTLPGAGRLAQVARLDDVMRRLRRECPWDAEQTHRSLVTHLVEETGEVVDAIEQGSLDDLREELGDLLLQVVFHCEIERQQGGFDLDDVAGDIADKLVRRHPHVFGGADVPGDLDLSWEQRKRAEKQRTSALDGIPTSLDPLARAQKVLSRAARHGVTPGPALVDPSAAPPTEAERVGHEVLALVGQATEQGIDIAQATRDALRALERQILDQEAQGRGRPASG